MPELPALQNYGALGIAIWAAAYVKFHDCSERVRIANRILYKFAKDEVGEGTGND
jgi:hypothetical protein